MMEAKAVFTSREEGRCETLKLSMDIDKEARGVR